MSSRSSNIHSSIKKGISQLGSIPSVFKKLEGDGHLSLLSATIAHIISRETRHSIAQLQKMKETSPQIDLSQLLVKNSIVFKESLKLIAGLVSNLNS